MSCIQREGEIEIHGSTYRIGDGVFLDEEGGFDASGHVISSLDKNDDRRPIGLARRDDPAMVVFWPLADTILAPIPAAPVPVIQVKGTITDGAPAAVAIKARGESIGDAVQRAIWQIRQLGHVDAAKVVSLVEAVRAIEAAALSDGPVRS
jgi:hypothetical protein